MNDEMIAALLRDLHGWRFHTLNLTLFPRILSGSEAYWLRLLDLPCFRNLHVLVDEGDKASLLSGMLQLLLDKPLHTLSLASMRGASDGVSLNQLPSLTALRLDQPNSILTQQVAHCPKVTSLQLHRPALQGSHWLRFFSASAASQQLRHLSIRSFRADHSSPISDSDLHASCPMMQTLQTLTLADFEGVARFLPHLAQCSSLETVTVIPSFGFVLVMNDAVLPSVDSVCALLDAHPLVTVWLQPSSADPPRYERDQFARLSRRYERLHAQPRFHLKNGFAY